MSEAAWCRSCPGWTMEISRKCKL